MHTRTVALTAICACLTIATLAQDVKEIKLIRANTLEVDKNIDANRLIGDVIFKHEGALMYCDSAYLFPDNSMKAWGRVKVKQGDSLRLFGDSLHYLGDRKLARLRGDVVLINKDMTLRTDYLDYDRANGQAYYLGGGELVNKAERNTLTSNIGYFFPDQNRFFFKDSVRLVHPDYTIESDTLLYNTESEVTYFHGPSRIISKENEIVCNSGWYDTKNDRSEFTNGAEIIGKETLIKGDSIYYDRKLGIGKAYEHVTVIDSSQNLVLKGDYTLYNEKDSTSLITGENAQMVQLVDADSLFMHADTLFAGWDSTGEHRQLTAWYQVKFFKPDFSGKCDSLVFSDADSTIQMWRNPIIWSEDNQITADSLTIRNYDGKIHWMRMQNNALIVSRQDSVSYNQISGKNAMGHFRKGDLRRVDVKGNGQTLYYATEDNGDLIGLNRADCSDMNIYIDSNTVDRILFLNQPKATLSPKKDITESMRTLDNFVWLDSLRPYHPAHIFYWGAIPDSIKDWRYTTPTDSTADSATAVVDTTAIAPATLPVAKPEKPGKTGPNRRDRAKRKAASATRDSEE